MADLREERESPRGLARLTGALYLYIMVAALFTQAGVRDRVIVAGDAAATAHNIVVSEGLWRLGVAADVSVTLCDVAVAALLFVLLRPSGPTTSLAAAAFRLAYSAAMAASAMLLIGPLLLVHDTASHGAAVPPGVAALVRYSLQLHDAAFDVALTLFGVHLVLIGALLARSRFLPRPIGVALVVAGLCYGANSFIGFVAPRVASSLFPWILLPGFLAEAALTLGLLVVGVDAKRWSIAHQA